MDGADINGSGFREARPLGPAMPVSCTDAALFGQVYMSPNGKALILDISKAGSIPVICSMDSSVVEH